MSHPLEHLGRAAVLVLAMVATPACDAGPDATGNPEAGPGDPSPAADSMGHELVSSFTGEFGLDERWVGDFDGMVEREFIRVLVVYSKTHYFFDEGTQRGVTYEALKEFENFINSSLGRRTLRVHLVIIPVDRNELIPALADGRGDVAAANLTITGARREIVDFSIPLLKGVSELVVTGPDSPPLSDLDDLSGKTIHVRRSSSYWESLAALNATFESRGLDPIEVKPMEEYLQDEDLLEMVNAGMLPMAVVDGHKAKFWAKVLPSIVVREDLAVRIGGEIGWAFRQHSPKLAEHINSFVRSHRKGTLFGNVVFERYLDDTKWVTDPTVSLDNETIRDTVDLFHTYGDRYGFDPLFLGAVAYQESGLDQSKRSRAGAVGVMQIKPSTAADPNVGISDVSTIENNIHAGAKYLAFLRDRYFSDPAITGLNREFLTLAAYNAGPARVRKLRSEAAEQGLDPNVWYRNVEVIAARRVGRETVRYVSNITKYWIAYRQIENRLRQIDGD
jgi:membrane-bound lytic murein transglycosylase MltF